MRTTATLEKAGVEFLNDDRPALTRQIVASSFIRLWSQASAILEPCGAFEWVALFYLGLSGVLM
ncbi:MAG: hypothetical protein WAM65_02860, partial [Candidatus Korobacteraceae bacterium]